MHPVAGLIHAAVACGRVGERQRQAEKLREIKSQASDAEDVARCLHQLSLCSLSQGHGKDAVDFASEALTGGLLDHRAVP